ncbi:MAG TPA: HAMP domain-containing histidine kinase [Epsilonproteobacteria bacterium]|nr:HAMP domain-containing histidine kinase [Campylobacterota bacterium]
MLSSEKRSLVRFLVIYLVSTLALFSLASWVFYTSSKHHLLDTQREVLKYEAEDLKSKLRMLHQSNNEILKYPKNAKIKSAIYDLDKRYIFGTIQSTQGLEEKEKNTLYTITKIEPYYLGAAYLLVTKDINRIPIQNLQKNIFLFMLAAGIFFSILGYYLGRLFVAPMRESLEKMNHFIQDTTHELNTPISTILTNVELIEAFGENEKNVNELRRIEIASKTLSRIYDDLTYLNLNHQYHRRIIAINMSDLVQERLAYFTSMAEAKRLKLMMNIAPKVIVQIDKNDALRLVDNLLSNAIKYNKHHGTLEVILTQKILIVRDTGIGIKSEDLKQIMQRFKRANKSEGGFGIGLHIVSQVCENYAYDLEIKSKINEGTEVHIRWVK